MYAYDEDLLESSRECMENYIKEDFKWFKGRAFQDYKKFHKYFRFTSEPMVVRKEVLNTLTYFIGPTYKKKIYEEIVRNNSTAFIGCNKDKRFLDILENIYTNDLEYLESILRQSGVGYGDYHYHHQSDQLSKFFLDFCMRYDLLFTEQDKYKPIYMSMISKMEHTEYTYRLLKLTLYKLYKDDTYLNFLAPYLNIDIYKNLMMEIDTKKQILSNIEFEKLKSSDFEVDSNFDLVFKYNKKRWNLVKQIGDLLLKNQMINLPG